MQAKLIQAAAVQAVVVTVQILVARALLLLDIQTHLQTLQ
jgi:hypothetical protein